MISFDYDKIYPQPDLKFSNSPSTLVLISAVALRDVKVDIDRWEFHVILVLESVGRVARVAGEIDSIAFGARCDAEWFVIGIPRVVLQILNDDAQFSAIIVCQVVQDFISNPQFTVGLAKSYEGRKIVSLSNLILCN